MLLNSWTKVQIIQSYRKQFIVHININDLKDIEEWWDKEFFISQMKIKHKLRYINWKEAYAILYTLVRWDSKWKKGKLIIIYDNNAIIQVINKYIIKKNALISL